MDGTQARQLNAGQTAQGRTEDEAAQGQLWYLCCCRCNRSKSPTCHPHGLNCRPGQMMVCASMGVDIHNVSIHGWADNALRTPSHLPLHVHHAPPAPMLVPSHLPDRPNALQDDMQRLPPGESMAVANQREKNSFYPQAPLQEEEAKHVFAEVSDHQIKTTDLPHPNHSFRVQSWLSCGRMGERVNCLSPSKGAPILSRTKLHHSVERSQLHQGRLLQFRLLSHWDRHTRLALHGQRISPFQRPETWRCGGGKRHQIRVRHQGHGNIQVQNQ